LPLARLAARALGLGGDLGADPIRTVALTTGLWTLRFLLATLAVTPLRRLAGFAQLAPYRRTFGLLAFTYASLHFLTYAVLDLWGQWDTLLEDIAKRPWITLGFTGFVLLVPLAVTSTRAWIRRLGKRWVQLHRLVYAAAVAGCVHFLWLVKKDVREPLIYAAILGTLFAARGVAAWRKASEGRPERARKRGSARSEPKASEVDSD